MASSHRARRAGLAPATPRLCVDTCTVLDIVRAAGRGMKPEEIQAAKGLLAAMRAGRLIGLLAPQVIREFRDNVQEVTDEAERSLDRIRTQAEAANAIVGLHRRRKRIDLNHFRGHANRARVLAEIWIAEAVQVPEAADAKARASDRVIRGEAPAARGKQELKDCLIVETYFDEVSALRENGVVAPIAFVSGNKDDYCVARSGLVLRPPLDAEFAARDLQFWPNLAAAKHALGL